MLIINLIFHFCTMKWFYGWFGDHRKRSQDKKTTSEKCNYESAKTCVTVFSQMLAETHCGGCLVQARWPLRGDTAVRGTIWHYWVWSSYPKIIRSQCKSPATTPISNPNVKLTKAGDCPGPAKKTHCIDFSNLLAAGKESYSKIYNVKIAQKVKINQNLLTLY